MKKTLTKSLKVVVTMVTIAVAALVVRGVYQKHFSDPWTRDGQVQAQVVQVAARVSAPVIKLSVIDNQFVKAGDVLFELDPRTFQASLDQAAAQLELARNNYLSLEQQVKAAEAGVTAAQASVSQANSGIAEAVSTIAKNKAELERQHALLPKNATSQRAVESAQASYDVSLEKEKSAQGGLSQAQASLLQAQASLASAKANRGAAGEANANIRAARASLREAQLNLEFTKVVASVDGYVTNLKLRIGSQAVANQAILALVDVDSFWVNGFFKETQIARVKSGDRALVTLMTYPDMELEGTVVSLGWGIAQQDGSTGAELLPSINPSFDWIRLAQRIPVKVRFDELPEGIELRVGTTASVVIHASGE